MNACVGLSEQNSKEERPGLWEKASQAANAYHHVSVVTFSGIPVLSRTYGEIPSTGRDMSGLNEMTRRCSLHTPNALMKGTAKSSSMAFPHIGTLSSCFMFAKESQCNLTSTDTNHGITLQWRMFDDSFVVILFTSWVDRTDSFYETLMALLYDTMKLMVGDEELKCIDEHIDQTKVRLKTSYAMLDRLFQTTPCFADLIQYTEVVECPENVVLQEHLKSYAARCNTPYAWLTLDDKVCAATNKWWKLPGSERNLLSILGKAISPAVKSFDIPIYLPQTSPSVPYRLVGYKLSHKCHIIALLGPTPSLQELEEEVIVQFWSPAKNVIQNCQRVLWPHGFDTEGLPLCNVIQSFILVNTKRYKILSTFTLSLEGIYKSQTSQQTTTDMDPELKRTVEERQRILQQWYFQCQSTVNKDDSSLIHPAKEAYIIAPGCKLYSTGHDNYRIFVAFSDKVPTISMARMAREFLSNLKNRLKKTF